MGVLESVDDEHAFAQRRVADGAVVVDARPFVAFGAGHVPGSISNTLRPVFGSWLGRLVSADRIDGTIIDVRQANEYRAGHIPRAHSF